jgi:predicted nucleic acid-binding protein
LRQIVLRLCVSLCSEGGIDAIDALYLNTAIRRNAILVSLDEGDFVKKVKSNKQGIEVYHVSEFLY